MKILHNFPISAEWSQVDTPTGIVTVFPYQIVVWVSLIQHETSSRPFPAVIDTGLNQAFALSETHLDEWAGMKAAQLKTWATVKINGQVMPLKRVGLALHSNIRGTREIADRPPHSLNVPDGVILFPRGGAPRLPLLGLRAFMQNSLRLILDGKGKSITVQTRSWF